MKTVKIVAVCMLFFVAGVFYCKHANATLFCYNTNNNIGITWQSGVFVYQVQNNDNPRPDIPNPGVQLIPDTVYPGTALAYCWANGPELAYLYANLPDLRWPVVNKRTGAIRSSIQPGNEQGAVFWVGDDAWFIINNL